MYLEGRGKGSLLELIVHAQQFELDLRINPRARIWDRVCLSLM